MRHLTPDELVDAVEGTLGPAPTAHLDSCDHCQREKRELAALLGDARMIDVPEPSPLFWERFSARLNEAVDAESAVPSRWPTWFRWPVLVPLGTLAAIVFAIVSAIPATPPDPSRPREDRR